MFDVLEIVRCTSMTYVSTIRLVKRKFRTGLDAIFEGKFNMNILINWEQERLPDETYLRGIWLPVRHRLRYAART